VPAVFFVELGNGVKTTWILCGESTFLKQRKLIHHVSRLGELFYVGKKVLLGNANQWIADPRQVSALLVS
jgi:hypothetical protein